MPKQFVPVEGNPFLKPVEGNPFEVQGDVAAAGRRLLAEEMQRRAAMEQLARGLTLPGRVVAGVEPTTPGEWSDEDEANRIRLENEAHDWSVRQAVRPKF